LNRAEYLERARSVLPGLRDRVVDCEKMRRLPDENFNAFQEAGLLRALQPLRWEGFELNPLTFYEGVIEVAAVCPSSAWVLGVVGVHNWQLALFPDQAQEDVWGADTSVQISSSYAPTGKVRSVDGGFQLEGRWSFSSGCDHCQWVFLGAIIRKQGEQSEMRTFLVPRSDYEIDDTWHVAGLSGTGSKDIVVADAFVPEHRTHSLVDAFNLNSPGQKNNRGASFALPFGMVFPFGISVPAIGAATGAYEAYRSSMRKKISARRAGSADDPFAHKRISEASSEISAARGELKQTWEAAWEMVQAGKSIPVDFRTRARWTSANIVQRCVRAVNILFEASGGHAIFLDHPMQRYFRDIHAMRAHAINNPDSTSQLFGFAELHPGEPPKDLFV
jgi:3-hydroxy-9,10-secoandrosta-1,3,5(10)-triene-9,17-dione monooxygenase